jgi:hypothetical protein
MKPQRIRRSRAKGSKMPEGAVYVGRPTIFGNPFPVDVYGHEGAIDRFRRLMCGEMSMLEMSQSSTCHRADVSLVTVRRWILDDLSKLRGKDLACWCHSDQKCHADTLLELANAPEKVSA